MNSLQGFTNVAIHLVGAGPFRTDIQHTWTVQSGWVLTGDGMNTTVIQLAGNAAGIRRAPCLSANPNFSTDNVTITNLTIDCNWSELSLTADFGQGGEQMLATGALSIWGNNNLIDHVRTINNHGSWANSLESFVMFVGGPKWGNGTNNTIQFCRAEQPQGNYSNPFALAGWVNSTPYYLITNSKVIYSTAIGNNDGGNTGFNSGGVNMANVQNCIVDSNTFTDCVAAAYIDTGSVDGLQVTNNTVTRGWQAVGLATTVTPKQNITISNNNFLIQNRESGGGSYGVVANFGTTSNLTVTNNVITFDNSGNGGMQFWGIAVYMINGANISNNTIGLSSPISWNATSGVGINLLSNVYTNGSPVPGL